MILRPIFFLCAYLFAFHASGTEQDVTFYTESYPPANFLQAGELKGVTVESLQAMWQHMGVKPQEISLVPWARGYKNTLSHSHTALFTMSRTQARAPLFKWVGPLFKSVHVLMAKKSSKIKIGHLGELFNYRVATIRGDISEISLQQLGYPDYNMAKVSELERAFTMMQSGRVDLIMISIHGFEHLSRQLNVDKDDYESVWTVNTVGNYIAFNKQTPDSLIQRYQEALEATKDIRDEIKRKYQLSKLEF